MIRTGAVFVFVAITLVSNAAPPVEACGDKFLLVGRSARFRQAYAAVYPATIVVFAQPQRKAAKAIRDPRLAADLKAAGHRVSVVEDERALTRILGTDSIDLVLTDVADADRVAKQADTSEARPKVLPVMFEPTKVEAKDIESQYHCRLTASDRADKYLAAIDDLMKSRAALKKKKS